jgi:hypothetical protein
MNFTNAEPGAESAFRRFAAFACFEIVSGGETSEKRRWFQFY